MPSKDANEIEDLEPSADPALDEQQAEPQGKAADDAGSSAATGEKSDSDMLSVVRDVVDKREPVADAASPAESDEDEDQEGDEKPAAKQDDEEYSDVPFHKHPRFQQLLRKSKANEQEAQLYRNVTGFLDQAGLSAEEAADGLSIMGLAKTNPAEAWKQIKPWVEKVLVAAGEVLPQDLQQRVQNGEMTKASALEISRSRAATQSMQAAQSFREQQAQRTQQRDAVQAIQAAAQSWEADRRAKDPNFDAKLEPLMKEVAWLQQKEGRPNTPDGVKDQLKRAYKAVNEQFRAPAPAPTQRKPITPIRGGQVAGDQRPAEQSTLDIVRANRRAS